MSRGFVKLFAAIAESTVWSEEYATRIVWVTMLAKADADGIVMGSVPGFARVANVTVDEMRAAEAKLSSPDPDSRTPDHEGRRIEAIAGGWRVLNYQAYRERGQGQDGSRAPYYREYRRRVRLAQQPDVARNTDCVANDVEQQPDVARNTEERSRSRSRTEEQERAERAPCTDEGLVRRRQRRQRSRETGDGRPATGVIAAVARELLAQRPELGDGDLRELLKTRCAHVNLLYDGQAVAAALDIAKAQLAKKV